MDNSQYHANRTHLSSSMLKLILKDIERFDREWNKGIKENESKPAFDEGSFTHSLILEPQYIKSQYAIFQGLRKAGSAFEAFKAENPGKTILSIAQKLKTEKLVEAYKARVEAVKMLQGGVAEVNLFGEILGVPMKIRPDYINVEQGYIVDVKTTAYPASIDAFKETIKDYMYDLSAALYCNIAYQNYHKVFDFYFIVISKSDLICDIYKASADTISNGLGLTISATMKYKRCKESEIWLDEQPKISYDSREYEIEEV